MIHAAAGDLPAFIAEWVQRFLDDLCVVRSANTVRAYAFDLRRWTRFCEEMEVNPFHARPRTAIEFIRVERERFYRCDRTQREQSSAD